MHTVMSANFVVITDYLKKNCPAWHWMPRLSFSFFFDQDLKQWPVLYNHITIINALVNYNKTSFLVQIKFITEDSKRWYYKY